MPAVVSDRGREAGELFRAEAVGDTARDVDRDVGVAGLLSVEAGARE